MRVLLVHEDQRGPGQGGGAESLLRDEAAGLKARGHTVGWYWGEGDFRRVVDQFCPDIVHVSTIHHLPDWLSLVAYLQDERIPHLWALMDYWPFCGNRMLLPDLARECDGCAAVTGRCAGDCGQGPAPADWRELVNRSPVAALNAYTADIYRRHGLRVDVVVELGVDTNLFRPDATRRNGQATVYTSSAWPDWPHKGLPFLRRALCGVGTPLHLITGQPRESVARGLQQADVYVFPSLYEETFGLCLCEAMACGCACIASDVAGARAQIDSGVTGLLVPPRDDDALRGAISLLLEDAALLERLGQAARAHVLVEHTLDAMAARWEQAYLEVGHG